MGSQIKRATISVTSNIVESFRKKTVKDNLHFYNIAESSLEEVKYQLILSFDLRYLNKEHFDLLYDQAEEVGRLLHGWIESNKKRL